MEWIVSGEPETLLFDSDEELVSAAKSWAAANMFSLFKLRSDKGKVVLACLLGNTCRSKREEGVECQRQSSTIKTGCPFRLNGRKQRDEKWKLNLTNLHHNHERPQSLVGIANARRDSNSQQEEIIRLSEANVRPRQIVRLLDENNLLIRKDIYNLVSSDKRRKLGERTVLEYLLENLVQTNSYHRHFVSATGELSGLFFAFEEAITLGKRFKTTFVVDATYKTNRFKLPLLHFIGIDCFGGSFSACFMLMAKEDQAEYLRALECFRECFGIDPEVFVTDKEDALRNAIPIVFPDATNLLCIWHINKNILKNCVNLFESRETFNMLMQDWNQVLYSFTEDQFNTSLMEFRSKYAHACQEFAVVVL
jgi:MULE transposase domain